MRFSDYLQPKDHTFGGTSRIAQRRNELALYLLLASLAMFFLAALLGYTIILWQKGQFVAPTLSGLPRIFFLSTVFAIGGGACLWMALRVVRQEKQQTFRRLMVAAFLLGVAFCLCQAVGLTQILGKHFLAADVVPSTSHGLIFFLVLLHALHFLAGLPALGLTMVRALRGRYDHEYHAGVRLCAIYWRFLDVVWIALFGAFLLTT